MLMVITDRLSKAVILEPCSSTEAETIARLFIKCFYRYHGIPTAIVSDRGVRFVSNLWKRVCQLLRIESIVLLLSMLMEKMNGGRLKQFWMRNDEETRTKETPTILPSQMEGLR